MQSSSSSSGFSRLIDGLATLIKDMVTDIHAHYSAVFYGDGRIAQSYNTSRDGTDQAAGLTDMVGGTVEGVHQQVKGLNHGVHGRLDHMRKEMTGRGEETKSRLDKMRDALTGRSGNTHSRLDHMRNQLTGRGEEPGKEQQKGQERGH